MKNRIVFLIAISTVVFLTVDSYGQNTLVISEQNNGQKITVSPERLLTLRLASGYASAGCCWSVRILDTAVLKQFGDWTFERDDQNGNAGAVGVPGVQIMKFAGVSSGQTRLVLEYKRPWEKQSPPVATFMLDVTSSGPYAGTETPYIIAQVPLTENRAAVSPGPSAYPAKYNLADAGIMTPIRDQQISKCGSCWAHATCGVFEILIKGKDRVARDLSEQWFVNCDRSSFGCSGGYCGFDHFVSSGAVYEADEPYLAANGTCKTSYTYHEKADSYKKILAQAAVAPVDTIKKYVYNYGPLYIGVRYNNTQFMNYKSGIFTYDDRNSVDHAIILIGWNDSAGGFWYLKNSFGTGWGESGYMRIKWGVSSVGYDPIYLAYKGALGPIAGVTVDNGESRNLRRGGIRATPNPSNGAFAVSCDKLSGDKISMSVFTTRGQKVYGGTFRSAQKMTVTLNQIPKGLYLITLTDKGTVFTGEVMITR